jgi:hypothetical protein
LLVSGFASAAVSEVPVTESGERLQTVRVLNDRDRLANVMGWTGESPELVLGAT